LKKLTKQNHIKSKKQNQIQVSSRKR
jgi:hypothetical protein